MKKRLPGIVTGDLHISRVSFRWGRGLGVALRFPTPSSSFLIIIPSSPSRGNYTIVNPLISTERRVCIMYMYLFSYKLQCFISFEEIQLKRRYTVD